MNKKKKGLYSKILIAIILIYMAFMGIWSFRILSHTGMDSSNLLTIIFSFFGFELASLLIKRLFAKDTSNDNENNNG